MSLGYTGDFGVESFLGLAVFVGAGRAAELETIRDLLAFPGREFGLLLIIVD